jgi:hypothetical protein
MSARLHSAVLLGVLAASAGACTDMSTPAELTHPQILAVRADPPVVEPGEQATLSVLVAGPDGLLQPALVHWGANVEVDGKGQARFVAPREVPAGGALVRIDAAVELGDGEVLAAAKNVGVGVALPESNPVITALLADGVAISNGAIDLVAGSAVDLEVEISPAPSEAAIYAWYSTVGEIDLYRRSPTVLLAPEEAGSGTLIAVFRDGLGVTWRVLAVEVE